jgi:hypothetical protein
MITAVTGAGKEKVAAPNRVRLAAAMTRDGTLLALGGTRKPGMGQDGVISLWDPVAFDPSGRLALAGKGLIVLWDLHAARAITPEHPSTMVRSAALPTAARSRFG